jgi:predicted dehydrogenase
MSKKTLRKARRRFLKTAALVGGISGTGYWTSLSAPASDSPNEKLNIGVIGVGNRGVSNIAEIKSENIAALCDVDRRYLDAMSKRHPSAKTHVDFRELIEQPDLDAVLISSPDHTHFHAAMLAMQRGLHIYCEKPLAHSIWEVRQMESLATRKAIVSQTGNQHHASDGYRRVAEIVQSETIGDVTEVHAWTNRPIWPQGVERPGDETAIPPELDWGLWLGPALPRPYNSAYHPRGWRGWFDFGCGALGDMGPHLLDPVVWALELGLPTTISAETSEVNDETFPIWSIVRFEFPPRGDSPPLRLTWYDGDKQPPEAVASVKRLPPNGVLFLGERAKLFAPDYGGLPIVIPNQKGEKIELPDAFLPKSSGHHQEWIAACKGVGRTSCDFSYGGRLTEICLLGNLAIRTGETIEWDPENLTAKNGINVSRFVRRTYRDGWPLP